MTEALFFISKSCLEGNMVKRALNNNIWQFCFFLAILISPVFAQSQSTLRDLNAAHIYDSKAEISLVYKLEMTIDSLIIHTRLTKHQEKSLISDYEFSFYPVNSYNEKLANTLTSNEVDSSYLGKKEKEHFITFRLPRIKGRNLIAVKIISRFSGFKHYYDIPLANNVPITIQTDTGSPIINSWLNPGRYLIHNKDEVFGFYYTHEFPTAKPPMVTSRNRVSKQMNVDSTFTVRKDEIFVIKNKGLYLLQTDTTSSTALSFRLEDKYFPKAAKLDQLVDPLIYITTKDERKSLETARENKTEFDQFWINLTRSSDRAKGIIKKYYDRVEEANQLFTTYKPGWKTDKGMIYIIFGTPDQVIKEYKEETWVYLRNQDSRRTEFKFVKASSIFSNNHYALIRDKKYADVWFKGITRIRQGRF